ncbi:chromosome partition protein smc [Legionella wadsworthii]|uniref:Chromosome partition protein Smc n=1 Tax=Legionella wadsworthii TaxID=28088 RepID=A0A378LTK4_9GAMM|nr:chromosome segregation protein SMC [Legionella wadsworthii]STY30608.1 chromosome partition protein smc [Legionella wadsworthii]
MHLKQLKLAGFKSFVDPTVVHFPSQLVAVVGPNGCGKSNIIDAVRWVMGESSARNLRGESMADVIFNGSSNRKSVGQASVELVFDNRLGRLTGPFSSYGEIAVKRVVTRDGDSSYYLNGSRCRRKDITDIFLGTGAGARGYSIIGQGTISQLIEARPEDLRVYLEEAAGVSKYKERRRETLQRIDHTRENLTRVADIREELDKQLQRLERQAKAAERYLILKDEERLCRAEILALKWRDFINQQQSRQQQIQELAIQYEQQQSRLANANKERVVLNETLHNVDEQTQGIQAKFYQIGTEIVRLEEAIQQQNREKRRLEQDQQQMQEDWRIAQERLQLDKNELLHCQQNIGDLEKQLEQLRKVFKEQEVNWLEVQKQQAEWEIYWQEVQSNNNNLKRDFQVTQLKSQHVEEKHQQTLLRLEKLHMEQAAISIEELQRTQTFLNEKQIKLIADQQFDALHLKQCQENTEALRSKLHDIEQQLRSLQDDFHHANSEYAALIAAQRAARHGSKGKSDVVKEWSEKPLLMDLFRVETKWQFACERVLNEALHAYVLETFDELWPQQEICKNQGVDVVVLQKRENGCNAHPRLIDQIKGDIPAHVYPLKYIYTAEHFEEALNLLPQLADNESIITPEGLWLGHGWVKFIRPETEDEIGLIARQQKITEVSSLVQDLQVKIDALRIVRDETHQQLQKSLKDIELQQLNVNASNEALRTNSSALSTNEQMMQHAEKQSNALALECEELKICLEETATEQCHIKDKLHTLEEQCREYEQQYQQGLNEKQKWLQTVASKNKQLEEARTVLHQTELEWEREKNKIIQIKDRIVREQDHLNVLQERLEHLALLCLKSEGPGEELKEQLAQQLQKHHEVELSLTLSREQLSQLKMQLEDFERNIGLFDLEVKRIQEQLGHARMDEQTLAVRASSLNESLEELGLQAQTVLEQVPVGMTQLMREDDLIAISEKIKRLGAINLAAIEEYTTEQQRKNYLDAQYNDLNEALATLETAIEKMDKETRARLENTFEQVNSSFKALFPRLFGGGRAQLELTCDNLLEAGIVVMAQPPGKRNSTIHLLSGGEKAMTAVALVFAIFQLNPSPFCMLDEVDAPLDDVNVGRFCALVKEMSQFVQFLFITHNKVTMELADHLIGVTMREPGVSRLVAVDVTQALAME